MKKILALILVAVLCLGMLASCVKPGPDGGQDQGNTPAGPSIEDAASYLHKIYKDKKETTMADFDVVAQVSINGVIFPVTWTCDNAAISIRESTKTGFYTVDLPDMITEEIVYTLTATISDANGNSTQKSYTFKAPAIDNSGVTSTPVEGVAYKLFLLQGGENRRYYALGTTQNNENKFINTTLNPKDGAEFFVEKVDGGYKIYTEVNGVKTYMYAKVTRTEDANTGTVKYSKFIGFNTEEGSVFSYNANKGGVWTVTVDNLVYGVGTYGSYTTISLSDESYFTPDNVGSSQYVMQFMTAEYANTLEEDKLPESPSDAEGILNQLYGLADGEQAVGSFTLTGKITALDNYNNPTIVVEGFENMPVYCYRLTVENAIGDTITVTATTMKNYGGTYEFMNCTLVSGGNQGGGETPDTPVDPAGNAVLDLTGNANLVNGSAQQNVFAANGITFTNDKASSTSDLVVQTSYAQRAYKGSTIKIEYPGMTQIVITFDDYESNGKTYMAGFDGMTVEGATFSRDNDVLTITFAAATDVFQSAELTSQVRIEKVEVFTGEVENPGEGGGNEGGNDTPVVTPNYTAPVAGQAYDLYMELPSAVVYFKGSLDAEKSSYLNTTPDANESVKIYFEVVTGGYNIYFMNGDVKTYINAEAYLKSNGYAGCHFTLGETATTVWTYDTTNGVLEVYGEIEGKSDTFFAGTYGTYSTVSLSGAYYKGQIASGTQFPARIVVAGGEVTPPAGGDNGESGDNTGDSDLPAADSTLTIEEAIALGSKYASATDYTGKYTTGKYYVTGKIESIANASKGNFYIVDENGNKLYVYGSYSADGSVGYDSLENKPLVGDVVTVYGVIGAYGPTIQLNNGWITAVTAHEHSFVDATCTTKKTCSICNTTEGDILGHTAGTDGICTVCGENLNAAIVEESFSISASAGTLASDSLSISWSSDHFNFVGKKANSSTAIRTSDSDHFRVYQGSEFSISGKNGEKITKVVITVTESKYASVLVQSLVSNGVTATADGSVITLTIDGGSIDTIVFSATAQFRVKSFVISYK